MKSRRAGAAGQPARSDNDDLRADVERLEAGRRRQAMVIATLSEAVSNFQRGLKALHAENAELRAESEALRDRLVARSFGGSRADDELVELAIEAGPAAPSIARHAVTGALAERVTASALADAQLLTSELVTNTVRHSGMPAGDEVVVRLRVWADQCRRGGRGRRSQRGDRPASTRSGHGWRHGAPDGAGTSASAGVSCVPPVGRRGCGPRWSVPNGRHRLRSGRSKSLRCNRDAVAVVCQRES